MSTPQWRTLLLNASYEPLLAIEWQRAICLQVLRKVQVVETYDALVHSPSRAYAVPAVARLFSYVSYRHEGVRFSRRNVFTRDDFLCQYCGVPGTLESLTFDHVLPKSRGGPTTWSNIVTACSPCNRRKGDRTPTEAGMPLLCEPACPIWLPGPDVAVSPRRAPVEWRQYLPDAA